MQNCKVHNETAGSDAISEILHACTTQELPTQAATENTFKSQCSMLPTNHHCHTEGKVTGQNAYACEILQHQVSIRAEQLVKISLEHQISRTLIFEIVKEWPLSRIYHHPNMKCKLPIQRPIRGVTWNVHLEIPGWGHWELWCSLTRSWRSLAQHMHTWGATPPKVRGELQ